MVMKLRLKFEKSICYSICYREETVNFGSGGHFVFQNEAKNYERHAFVDINLLYKFGEFMFINKGCMKPFLKRDGRTHARTHGHRVFYNLLFRAYRLLCAQCWLFKVLNFQVCKSIKSLHHMNSGGMPLCDGWIAENCVFPSIVPP